MFDFFSNEQISITPITYTYLVNDETGKEEKTEVQGSSMQALKFNRSAASRYFSSTWAENVSDVLIVEDPGVLTAKSKVLIGSTYWSCEEPVNVAEQSEIYTIGLTRTVAG